MTDNKLLEPLTQNRTESVAETMMVVPDTGTPFDDVYRTLLEKCRQLIIPVINDCFKTNYPNVS